MLTIVLWAILVGVLVSQGVNPWIIWGMIVLQFQISMADKWTCETLKRLIEVLEMKGRIK